MTWAREEERFIRVHAGLTKAGSTYLQNCVFPRMFPSMQGSAGAGLKLSAKKYREFMEGWEPDPGCLLSTERFSASQSGKPGSSWRNFEKFADRIETLSVPARVFLVIRKHEDWLLSEWIDARKKRQASRDFEEFCSRFLAVDIQWAERIQRLKEGKGDVLVVLHEDLQYHPEATLGRLAEFWGVPRVFDESDGGNVGSRGAGRRNVNPSTTVSLAACRMVTRCHRPIDSVLAKIAEVKGEERLTFHYVRDAVAETCNRLPVGRSLRQGVTLPEDIADLAMRDWQQATAWAWRPEQVRRGSVG